MIIWTLATGSEADLDKHLIQLASNVLSDDELSRAQRFQFEADRNRFVAAHALCRLMLSSQAEFEPSFWEFAREQRGRPYVVNSQLPMDFNLSHTTGMVGCALSTAGRVGFDLEYCLRPVNIDSLARRKFAPEESEDVLSFSDERQRDRFFRYWTLKEAYIKVTGRGLHQSLDSFCFDLNGSSPMCRVNGQCLDQYRFGLIPAGSTHQAAWAFETSKKQPVTPEVVHLDLDAFQEMLG